MRKLIFTLVLTLAAAAALPASAQRLNLNFPDLENRADEVVDVTLDSDMLQVAARFLSSSDPEEREIRDIVRGLRGIYVRSYEFSKEGQYDRRLFEQVKAQLGPTWKPFVNIRSKTKDNVVMMADMRGDQIHGLVIVASEPREFTVVNIDGLIDIDRLAALEGRFGVPTVTEKEQP